MSIRIRLSEQEANIIVDALAFYRLGNIDIAEPLEGTEPEYGAAEVEALERRFGGAS